VWNMTYDGAEKLKGMILWWASLDGPKAVPGTYRVSLKVAERRRSNQTSTVSNQESNAVIERSRNDNTIEKSQPFTILADPRAESTIADMQKQFDFIKDVNATMDNAHKSIKKIRSITKQLSAFETQYKDDDTIKDLLDKAKALKEQLSDIEKALYQTKNRSGQDPLNFPIRLTNKLGHLNSLVRMGDFAPTDQDIAVKNELTAKINTQLEQFNNLISNEVKAFNKAFNEKALEYLFVEE